MIYKNYEIYGLKVRKKNQNRGFSIVELAIVITIIGLLIAGIITGAKLIDQAKLRGVAAEITGIRSAVSTFIATYEQFPGDYTKASTHIAGAVNGNGDGEVEWGTESGDSFYQLVTGNFLGTDLYTNADSQKVVQSKISNVSCYQPLVHPSSNSGNALDGDDGQDNAAMDYPVSVLGKDGAVAGNNCRGALLLPSQAEFLDTKFDNGKPLTGSVIVLFKNTPIAPTVTRGVTTSDCVDSVNSIYNSLSKVKLCNLVFKVD